MPTNTPRTSQVSPRQEEVLRYVANGLTNAEIADRLGISLDGVKWHLREIFARLGVDSREQAVAAWRAERGFGARLRSFRSALAVPLVAKLGVAAAVAVLAGGAAIGIYAQRHDEHNGVAPSASVTFVSGRILSDGSLVVSPSTVVANGQAVRFDVCQTVLDWGRPTPDSLRERLRDSPALFAAYLSPFQFRLPTAGRPASDVLGLDEAGGVSMPPSLGSCTGAVVTGGYHVAAVHKLGTQAVVSVVPAPTTAERVVLFDPGDVRLYQVVDPSGAVIAEAADGSADWTLGVDGRFASAIVGAHSEPFPVTVRSADGPLRLQVMATDPGQAAGELLVLTPDAKTVRRRIPLAPVPAWEPGATLSLDPGSYLITVAGLSPDITVLILREDIPLP